MPHDTGLKRQPERGQDLHNTRFSGAKLALFLGDDLLVIQRDQRPDIPWPGHWDLPGGGREGDETPQACALRETREEVGLIVPATDLVWANSYRRPHGIVWFFAAHLPEQVQCDIVFGSEGQGWRMMTPDTYCAHPLAVPHFAAQLRLYMAQPEFHVADRKTPREASGGR